MRRGAKRSASRRDDAEPSSQQRRKRVKVSGPEAEVEYSEDQTGSVNFAPARCFGIRVCATMMRLARGEFCPCPITPAVEVPASVVILLLLEVL